MNSAFRPQNFWPSHYPWYHSEFPSISSTTDAVQRPKNLYSNIGRGFSSDAGSTQIGVIQDVENVVVDHMDVNMNVGYINDQTGVCVIIDRHAIVASDVRS